MAWARALGVRSVFACKFKSLKIPTLLQTLHKTAKKEVLVDSGATDNFISPRIMKQMKIRNLSLMKPQSIWNIDGTHNKAGTITHYVDLQVCCGAKIENMKFLITDQGDDDIILGYPWLSAFQPKINWKEAVLSEEMQPLIIKTLGLKIDDKVQKIKKAWIQKAQSLATPGEEIFVIRYDNEKIRRMSAFAELAVKALPKEEKTWEQIVLEHYH
jgi:hypothetical protein